MHRSFEVEYCNLELRFDRRHIQNFVKSLIQEGYSLYWNESEQHFIISVRTGRRLVKLKFHRLADQFKIVGDYSIRDEKLAELLEKMIGDTRGHAIVKRFKERQVVIENIVFGEMIRLVEISGVDHKVLYQKQPVVTFEEMMKAFQSKRAEHRAKVVRMELDYELATLFELINSDQPRQDDIDESKERLQELRREMLLLEL